MPITKRRLLPVALLALAAVAGPDRAAQAQGKDLTMGNVNPPKHGTSQAAQQFVDKLAELSGGKIKVAHHHSGALGGEREVAQQIQLGAVDFGPITTAPLSTLVPEMSVFQLPYIFRDYDHVFKALDGSDTLTKYYDAVLDKKGLKLVGFIAAGYRGIYGHGAINSLADVKGKKVRVQEDKILVATFKALGMISTPIAFPEVATALQTKVIDFAEGGVNTFYHNKFYDIVKYVADVRHTHQAVALIMSKAAWPKQDAAGQKAIMDAWAHARAFNRKFILDEDKSIQDQVRGQGRDHHQARRHAVPAGDAERLRGVLRHAGRQGRQEDGRLHPEPSSSAHGRAHPSERPGGRGAPRARSWAPPLRRARPSSAALILAVMAGAVFLQVVLRYLGLTGIDGLEEVPRYLFVWLVMIGAAAAMQRGEHTVLDYFVNLLGPARARRSCSC